MAPHLLVQAIIAGSSVLLFPLLAAGINMSRFTVGMTRTLLVGLALNLFIIIFGEILTRHGTTDAHRAMKLITHGPFKNWFWFGAILFGNVLPLLLLFFAGAFAPAVVVAAVAVATAAVTTLRSATPIRLSLFGSTSAGRASFASSGKRPTAGQTVSGVWAQLVSPTCRFSMN